MVRQTDFDIPRPPLSSLALAYLQPSALGAHVLAVDASLVQPSPATTGVTYLSTRDASQTPVSFETAVMTGLAPDRGLYVPAAMPRVTAAQLQAWHTLAFADLSFEILSLFIGRNEIAETHLRDLINRSYRTFSSQHITPLVPVAADGTLNILELFHGPTCSFKDVALQFVGNLFDYFLRRQATAGAARPLVVVGATSGDTGSAAIEGLRGKANVQVFMLHPHGRVAPIQEAQMTTILDANVHNVAVDGTFDDCQAIVKSLFADEAFRSAHALGAVNSINWARILAQIVYYFFAYYRWIDAGGGRRSLGDKVKRCSESSMHPATHS